MIFAALLGVAALHLQEPMKWVGEVKAFDFYTSRECLPQQRLLTIYAARKLFEDGSTVTIVRAVPSARAGLPPMYFGGGRIERDATNTVTRMASGGRFVNLPGLHSPNDLESWDSDATLDPKRGVLQGRCTTSDKALTGCKIAFPASSEYLLDPIEALAFPDGKGLAAGWLMPSPFSSIMDPKQHSVAIQMVLGPPTRRSCEFRRKRQFFRVVDIQSFLVGSSERTYLDPAGTLLFHDDGSLAAYFPRIGGWWRLPSSIYHYGPFGPSGTQMPELPPFALTGKLKEMWDNRATHDVLPHQVLVPSPVSASKRNEILAMIEDRTKPESEQKPVDGDQR